MHAMICDDRRPIVVVTGASGVGKTSMASHFVALMHGGPVFRRTWTQSLYRTSWVSAAADIRRRLGWAPQNATVREIEDLLIASCRTDPTLILLDNVDHGNVDDVRNFADRWMAADTRSSLIVTAQPLVAARFDVATPRLELTGIQSSAAVLELLSDLTESFTERELLDVGALVEFNPQKLLFLNWIAPSAMPELTERAQNLRHGDGRSAVEDVIEGAGIPALFFLALGIHRSFQVTDTLLSSLWDNFSSRGAAAYIRAREQLLQKKVLTPIGDNTFSLHESVHLQLEKLLLHRVGADRIRFFHLFFAEYYIHALRHEVSTLHLTHFVYHSVAAKDFPLAFQPVADRRVAKALGVNGSAVLAHHELERLDTPEALSAVTATDRAALFLTLAGLCNDLSDHQATLAYTARAEEALPSAPAAAALRRQVWYYRAVGFSNLGQSDRCLQEYFRIVESCTSDDDELACLSLGYLAHDLKYRDLGLALEIGEQAMQWAGKNHAIRIGPKNMCSYAESLVIAGRHGEALELFGRAARLAEQHQLTREVGRIETNRGFVLALLGSPQAEDHLRTGQARSKAVGDRRRQTQALLYSGVNAARQGERDRGRHLIRQAAELLRALGDGRYFVSALCWCLQLDGIQPQLYPQQSGSPPDYESFFTHADNHTEFSIYYQFWWRHLSDVLRV